MKMRKIGVLLLLAVLILGGFSMVLGEVTSIFATLLDLYEDGISISFDGEGGGGGQPQGGGGG